MKISVNEIGFDFDGVIADTGEAFVELVCSKYGYCGVSINDITSFDVEKCVDIPKNTINTIFREIQEDSVGTGLHPVDGAIDAISTLVKLGKVYVITARSLKQPVLDWFAYHFPDHVCEQIEVVATGDPDDKLRYIRERRLKYFVDDRTKTCVDLHVHGVIPLIFTQPWNAGKHNLPAVSSWMQIIEMIDCEVKDEVSCMW